MFGLLLLKLIFFLTSRCKSHIMSLKTREADISFKFDMHENYMPTLPI